MEEEEDDVKKEEQEDEVHVIHVIQYTLYMLYMLNIAQLNIAQFRNNLSHDCCCKLELTVTSYVALHGAICYILYLLYFIFGCARIPANSWADLCIFSGGGGGGNAIFKPGGAVFCRFLVHILHS